MNNKTLIYRRAIILVCFCIFLTQCKNEFQTCQSTDERSINSLIKINLGKTEPDSNGCGSLEMIDEPCLGKNHLSSSFELRISIERDNKLKMIRISHYKDMKVLTLKTTPLFHFGISRWGGGNKYKPIIYNKFQAIINDSMDENLVKSIKSLHLSKGFKNVFDGTQIIVESIVNGKYSFEGCTTRGEEDHKALLNFETRIFDPLLENYSNIK
jgi:hypothetical protein